MQEKEYAELSNQELLDKRKKIKTAQITSAVMVGFLVGVSVYSAVKNGIGFFTFFPLFFVFLLVRKRVDTKAIDEEIKSRGL